VEFMDNFWLLQPRSLWNDWRILPHQGMEEVELYNVMTRLVLVLALLLFVLGFVHWWLFLFLGLVLVIAIWWCRCWTSSNNVHSLDTRGSGDNPRMNEHLNPNSTSSHVTGSGSGANLRRGQSGVRTEYYTCPSNLERGMNESPLKEGMEDETEIYVRVPVKHEPTGRQSAATEKSFNEMKLLPRGGF